MATTTLTTQQTFDLALQNHEAGQLAQAEQLYRQILAQQPNHGDALHLLGVIAHQVGQNDVALDLIGRAIALNPENANIHSNLGAVLSEKGRLGEAIAAYHRAIALNPGMPDAHNNLGNALRDKGQWEEAIAAYRKAIILHPGYPEAHNNLGIVLEYKGQLDEAIAAFAQAIASKHDFPEAFDNLGNALRLKGELDEAIAAFRRAIALKPDYAQAHNDLGVVLGEKGQQDEAIASYRQAVALQGDFPEAHDNLVYALHFHPGSDAQAIAEENRRWNGRHAESLKQHIQPHTNDRSADRRIKIGYVSPDFRVQAESYFTIPLLENHDHASFEIHCYSSVSRPDHITERCRKHADVWREVYGETDDALAQRIRDDRIDILIDLTMHMAYNRALLFARKPAPVQVCWLAYPGSTGLETIDYRITDYFMDPADADTSCYSEQSIRLPDCWVVYDPMIDIPPRVPEQTGAITFGSLNNAAKLNDPLLTLWARVLQAVPGSRMILQVRSPEHRQRISCLMESLGIARDRLEFVGWMNRQQYLRTYDNIDIALDPLPYNGITTTCDALYMGTPVLTLTGQTAAGKAGKAMLTLTGLSELVAHDPDEFVRMAAELAADLPRLTEIRRGLRARLIGSRLMDAPRFARNMEAAYREMWRNWCGTTPANG